MQTDGILIKTNQEILRSFVLPYKGSVLVRTGQEVDFGDPIAEVSLPARYQVFDVVNHFRINPARIDKYLQRLVGDKVRAGDVIAQKPGLFSRIFRASQDGQIVSIRDGKVTLAMGERTYQVRAGFPGLVVELVPDRGAVVAAQGALLQGVWGNNLIGMGELVWRGAEAEADKHQGQTTTEGKIVVRDHLGAENELRALIAQRPTGLVFGSLAPSMLPALEKADLPVMCLAGFGDFQVDPYSAGWLERMAGKTVYLNASQADDLHAQKPELILPGADGQDEHLFPEEKPLTVGSKVRLTGAPYTGSVGEVIELPAEPEVFPSGFQLQVVVVQRPDDLVVHVPVENVELIRE